MCSPYRDVLISGIQAVTTIICKIKLGNLRGASTRLLPYTVYCVERNLLLLYNKRKLDKFGE